MKMSKNRPSHLHLRVNPPPPLSQLRGVAPRQGLATPPAFVVRTPPTIKRPLHTSSKDESYGERATYSSSSAFFVPIASILFAVRECWVIASLDGDWEVNARGRYNSFITCPPPVLQQIEPLCLYSALASSLSFLFSPLFHLSSRY